MDITVVISAVVVFLFIANILVTMLFVAEKKLISQDDVEISINDDVIIISGQIMINVVDDIEVVYLVANEVPIAKFDNFYLVEKNQAGLENEIIWNFAILENYLPDGCKKISIVGIMNNLPFVLDNRVELCTK